MKKGGSTGEVKELLVMLGGWRETPDWKGRSKTIFSLFADDMILYIGNPKEFTKNY